MVDGRLKEGQTGNGKKRVDRRGSGGCQALRSVRRIR
jgi:hypothetical protein